ncbi:dehydrogenase, partial [Methanopyrus kandleri]|uniref:Predicted dehydrogenase related to phosphoglycerate dehydrogenase, a n=2 Tax=Methanopyrus kandleri TaxID=2320 RepID=Q8TYI0_METKA
MQLLKGRLRSVVIKVGEEPGDREREALKRAMLKGCLDRILQEPVTMVNAVRVKDSHPPELVVVEEA